MKNFLTLYNLHSFISQVGLQFIITKSPVNTIINPFMFNDDCKLKWNEFISKEKRFWNKKNFAVPSCYLPLTLSFKQQKLDSLFQRDQYRNRCNFVDYAYNTQWLLNWELDLYRTFKVIHIIKWKWSISSMNSK